MSDPVQPQDAVDLWNDTRCALFFGVTLQYFADQIAAGATFPKPMIDGRWRRSDVIAWTNADHPEPPCALYRHFDAAGRLLYVGISANPFARTSEHTRTAHWFDSVRRIEIEWFPSTDKAFAAETNAIKSERPAHNIAKQIRRPLSIEEVVARINS